MVGVGVCRYQKLSYGVTGPLELNICSGPFASGMVAMPLAGI